MPKSLELAKFYMAKRKIPSKNLIILNTTSSEHISRNDYEREIAQPVLTYLDKQYGRIKCLTLMFGIPLKITAPRLTFTEKSKLRYLNAEKDKIKQNGNKDKLKKQADKIKKLRKTDQIAAVDSEIALLSQGDYPLSGWLPNPAYIGLRGKVTLSKKRLLMVSRLDGPNPAIVKRIINDTLQAEQDGLKGKAILDARWPKPKSGKSLSGYALYDNSIHLTATLLRDKMPVVLDDRSSLFPVGSRLPAALYCGWYSLAKYVDAFAWQTGSVGYHIASAECTTLKKNGSQVWCKVMLEKGISATIGPVSEPYVQAFPLPNIFFGLLTDGRFTLAEAYTLSLPYLSWQMILIGDPLYRVKIAANQ
jgi:uncharacterized protein (TIGR03790 family)